MLEFSDAPYQFFPSTPSVPIIVASRIHNRFYTLPHKAHRITEIQIKGDTAGLAEIKRRSDARLLFVANHPTHSDPQSLTEVQRRLGHTTCFMAAYDVFLRSKFNAWIMQHNGAFSIDRESTDRKSMATAVEILAAGKYSLSIFPEGNVHFTNDRVSPFQDGASFIAVRAQKTLAKNATVFAVPVALKYTHLTDCRPEVSASLAALATAVGETVDREINPVEEMMRIGRHLLVHLLSKREFLTATEKKSMLESGCLFETLNASATRIVTELENKIGLESKPDERRLDRIRRIRTAIRQILTDPKAGAMHDSAQAWSREALLALRIIGYGAPYASEKPTLDRFAETVERMNEDFFNRATPTPFGDRAAIAHFGRPINLAELVGSGKNKSRDAVSTLSKMLESSIQSSLDEVNASLTTPGSQLFEPKCLTP